MAQIQVITDGAGNVTDARRVPQPSLIAQVLEGRREVKQIESILRGATDQVKYIGVDAQFATAKTLLSPVISEEKKNEILGTIGSFEIGDSIAFIQEAQPTIGQVRDGGPVPPPIIKVFVDP